MRQISAEQAVLSRRTLLKSLALAAGAGASASIIPSIGFAQAGADTAKSTLILLGTQAGPGVGLARAQAANVVIAGGQPYLIDCGYGALRALVEAGLRANDVRNIFITHLHNDHTSDLAAMLSIKWTGGSQTNPPPASVYGPFGSKAMVDAAIAFFKGDVEIRMMDEGRTVRPETIYKGNDLSAPKVTEVFRDERVTVQAVENTHFPERAKAKMPYRSLAYRINTSDRSFVFSGDTAYSTNLIELARGADVFVCETMSMAMRQQLQGRGVAANTESVGRHVLETHSTTEEVGKMAAEAKVKTVVLSHLLGAPGGQRANAAADPFTADVKKFFSGEVIVGRDQMRI